MLEINSRIRNEVSRLGGSKNIINDIEGIKSKYFNEVVSEFNKRNPLSVSKRLARNNIDECISSAIKEAI